MGLLDKLFKKTPSTVQGHIIDPNDGYSVVELIVGEDVPAETVSKLADGGNLYIINVYKEGRLQQIMCKKEMWLSAKAQMDAIESEGKAAMEDIKESLRKL